MQLGTLLAEVIFSFFLILPLLFRILFTVVFTVVVFFHMAVKRLRKRSSKIKKPLLAG